MGRYLIRNRQTEAIFEVEAWCAEVAFDRLGWNPAVGEYDCYILRNDVEAQQNEEPLRLGSA